MPSNLPIDGHSFRRVEVLTGTPRRRRWSAAEKVAIVAESQAPGAQAAGSRCATGCIATDSAAGGESSDRTRLLMRWPNKDRLCSGGGGYRVEPAIEIEIGCAIVRVWAGVDLALLGKVLRLLKAIR